MPLSDVAFQDAAQEHIQRAFRASRMPHAYLFSGPSGVGKEMLATRLAEVLLCAEPKEAAAPWQKGTGSEPSGTRIIENPIPRGACPPLPRRDACGRCTDCKLFAAGSHPDFHRIHRTLAKLHPDKKVRDRKATELGVDVIRHFVIEKMGLRSNRGRAKVFVICEAERMNPAAQNALLKTLEEPPEQSYLILLAVSADALLPTTRSRCQQVPFRRLPAEFVMERLTQLRELSPDAARFLAELGQGSLGQSLQAADVGLHELISPVMQVVATSAADPLSGGRTLSELAKGLTDFFKDQAGKDDEEAVDTNASRSAQLAVFAVVSAILRDVHRIVSGAVAVGAPQVTSLSRSLVGASPELVRKAVQAVATAEYQVAHSLNTSLIFDAVGVALGQMTPAAATRR